MADAPGKGAPPGPASPVVAAPLTWLRHVNLTNILTVAFLAFCTRAMYNLYSIAVPPIPPLVRPDGSLRPAMRPLWAEARDGLELELVLSASQQRARSPQAAKAELLLLRGGSLGFTPEALHAELDLELQLLRAQPGGNATADAADEEDRGAPSPAFGGRAAAGKVQGLRVVCHRGGDASPASAALCLSLARQWAAQAPSPDSYLLWQVQGGGGGGVLAWARALLGGGGSGGGDDAAAAAGPALAPHDPLVVGEWRTPPAVKLGRSLTRGQPVFAHAALVWRGLPVLPPQMIRHLSAGPPAPASLQRPSNVPLPGQEVAESGAVAPTGTSPAGGEWGRFDELKVATTTAALVADAGFLPPQRLRYLWQDPLGTRTPAVVDSDGRVLDPGAGLKAAKAPVGGSANGTAAAVTRPASGQPWPHWMGQLSLFAITSFDALPRDELPPQIYHGVRADPTRSVHVPLLASNPVRPTRDRLHALNASVASLPLRLSLAPAAVGKWQLLTVLDGAVNSQKALGASEKETDDFVRLMAETPLWLLWLTFAVSFAHILFDVLAFKNDVSWWQSAASLSGVSVRSLSHQLVSNAVISVYLWREGSSMLVLVPQAANTLLFVWKMARAAGITLGLRHWVLPTVAYNARLHASASRGKGATADEEAVHYMTLLLAPFLAGFAAYSLVYHRYTGWAEYALTTAVAFTYGSGFALMCPQLYVNWKLKSVAHLPWKVLGYRFFSTVVDDLFASIIKMPLMHRVSVFRDDVVFVLYMLQRRWYPVDRSRPAEGYEGEDTSEYAFGTKATASATVAAGEGKAAAGGGGGGAASAPAPAPEREVRQRRAGR